VSDEEDQTRSDPEVAARLLEFELDPRHFTREMREATRRVITSWGLSTRRGPRNRAALL
jgi:hypothetical protein